MTRNRALLISAAASTPGAFILAPLISAAIGAPLFGLGNPVAFLTTWCVLSLILRRRKPEPLDVAAARREAHAAGFPFIESDGTLSWPPEQKRIDFRPVREAVSDEEIHQAMHERRLTAEQWNASVRDPAETSRWPGMAGLHMEDCRCMRVWGIEGPGLILTDSCCKALRSRL